MPRVGKNLTKMYVARIRLGLTQQDVADKLGVTQPRISAWENNNVEIPEARREQIAKILGLKADELGQRAL